MDIQVIYIFLLRTALPTHERYREQSYSALFTTLILESAGDGVEVDSEFACAIAFTSFRRGLAGSVAVKSCVGDILL